MLCNISAKVNFRDRRQAFQVWRLNSGMALKQYENQEKVVVLAKAAQKIYNRTHNFIKIQYYQKWKQMALRPSGGDGGTNREHIVKVLSELVTESEAFNKCVENDQNLALLLNEKIHRVVGGQHLLSSDFWFFDDVKEEQSFNERADVVR